MISFEWIWVFLFAPLPLIIYWLLPPAKHSNQAVLKVPFYDEIEEINQGRSLGKSKSTFRLGLLLLIWLLLLLAGAKPTWIGNEIALPTKGRDLMLAVDVSGSMQQQDMKINDQAVDRLTAVKSVLRTFIQQRKGDRLGLILFGSNAYLQSPLTFDQVTLEQFLLEARIGIAGEATAIGDAIGLSIKRLKDRPVDSRILILLTDGSNNAGEVEPLQAAKLAKEKELKIYTIGIGADEMTKPGIFGSSFFSRNINPSADLDEKTLSEIAIATGGQYFRARDTADLDKIYQEIDKLEPIEAADKSYRPKKSLYWWFLSAALILSWMYCLLLFINKVLEKRSLAKEKASSIEGSKQNDESFYAPGEEK